MGMLETSLVNVAPQAFYDVETAILKYPVADIARLGSA